VLHDRLEERASPLAGLYASAVLFLEVPTWPGRHHLLGHAVREIAQRLPDFLDPQPRTRADEASALKSFICAWCSADLPTSPIGLSTRSSSLSEDDGSASTVHQSTDQDSLAVPLSVAKAAASLVETYEQAATNNYTKAASIILTGRLRDGQVVPGAIHAAGIARDPTVVLWTRTVGWFMKFTHLDPRADRTLPPEDELARQFKIIEDVLEAILAPFYQVVDDLDEYLAIANAPGGSSSPPRSSAGEDHSSDSEGDLRD
jgi:hypothetical protein